METCINYCEPGWAYMSSDERRWINHLRKLNKTRPDECIILKQPENNDGIIYAKFPQKWARVAPPKQVLLTDEERTKRAEKLQQYRKTKALNPTRPFANDAAMEETDDDEQRSETAWQNES